MGMRVASRDLIVRRQVAPLIAGRGRIFASDRRDPAGRRVRDRYSHQWTRAWLSPDAAARSAFPNAPAASGASAQPAGSAARTRSPIRTHAETKETDDLNSGTRTIIDRIRALLPGVARADTLTQYADEEPPLRSELFSAEQLEQHGRNLAVAHRPAAGHAVDVAAAGEPFRPEAATTAWG